MLKSIAMTLAGAAMLAMAGQANAATCSAFVSGALTENSKPLSCAMGDEQDDKTNGGNIAKWSVNDEAIFGGGWTEYQRTNRPGTDFGDIDFYALSTAKNGMFQLKSGFWDKYAEAMVVFDGSNSDRVRPGDYVAFLLKPNTYKVYTYLTPFLERWNNALRSSDIQSFTVYTKPIPVPPAALLFMTALGGIGMLSRKRREA
jgi:hypothetical protein